MASPQQKARSSSASNGKPRGPVSDFDRLRALLTQEERERLDALESRLDDGGTRSLEMSRSLVSAVVETSERDAAALAMAMTPTVESALERSVKRNPQPLIDAVFPILGPAIRKSMATAMASLTQAVNRTVEHTFTIRGLRWRWTAWRTGQSFADVVLANTLQFRVDQVFLIHRESGLLLANVARSDVVARDPDAVSAMLRAIQDFVHDSFAESEPGCESGNLESMRVGGVTIGAEVGPLAILAFVVRGTPPASLRDRLQETLETIHADRADALRAFKTDNAPFVLCEPALEECLIERQRPKQRSLVPIILGTLVAAAVIAVAISTFHTWTSNRAWRRFVKRLAAEPGIVVASTAHADGRYRLTGLRDKFARDPEELRREMELSLAPIDMRWEPILSSHPAFVVRRAQALLLPPSGVRFRFEDGTLFVKGVAPPDWVARARRFATLLPSVERIEFEGAGK